MVMAGYALKTPQWQLVYRGTNITADISRMVTAITYVDRLSDSSGECELILEDRDKLWQGPWYPQQGDVATLSIGYRDGTLLSCGDLQVDELECDGPPDRITLRCIAAWITPAMRTPKSVAYEAITLPALAAAIAAQYKLTVSSASAPLNVRFERISQRHETDLEFLRRIALAHGYNFTVRGVQLVFYAIAALETGATGPIVERANVTEFSFVWKSYQVYKGAQVSYQAAINKELVTQSAVANQPIASRDTLRLLARCADKDQALLKAEA